MLDFSGFEGRYEDLIAIRRYNEVPVMFYRTDNVIHSLRVALMIADAKDYLPPSVDPDLVITLALVHDDPEIITGDDSLRKKREMTPEEKREHDLEESEAIEILVSRYPTRINGYIYRDILQTAKTKDTLETQIGSYFDKLDALCESLHENLAGNPFINPVERQTPTKSYLHPIIPELLEAYPALADFIPSDRHPLLAPIPDLEIDAIIANGKPHTAESIKVPTGIPQYDRWRELTATHLGIDYLIEQIEHTT